MKLWLVLLLLSYCFLNARTSSHQAVVEDNDFAEFEDFEEEDDVKVPVTKSSQGVPTRRDDEVSDTDEALVEDEDEEEEEVEFEHFQDDEEFEGFDQEKSGKSRQDTPDIKITKVPLHLHANWDSFYMEMIMVAGLVVYFLNFVTGRSKNQKLANAWFNAHKTLLEQNFSLVGDDGKTSENENPGLIKESENVFTLWCSGRLCCEGMLVEFKFLKRQDLIHAVMQLFKPSLDQIIVRVTVSPDDMDTFVFALSNKKSAVLLSKDMADISAFCPEKKSVDKFGLPSSFVMFNEIGEVANSILDSRMLAILTKYEDMIDFMHFSDQYSGVKLQDDSQSSKLPEVKKVLIFCFNVPGKGHPSPEHMESMHPLMQMVFYCIDKVKRLRLSKESKQKAEKTRLRVEEAFLKTTHQQRVEAAQQRREDKKRAEKERIMNEDDPDKQRKWEEREHRREMKKRAPKLKQLKVKAM